MNVYSKDNIKSLVSSMNKSKRFSHGILITGEKGSGRKFTAKYIAMSLLCEDLNDGLPCMKCNNCKRIAENIHPDVIFASEGEGKSGNYTAEKIRNIIMDSSVMPNDGDKKIYIIPDCEKLTAICQNALLKTIEEPEDYLYFIFTSLDKSPFLPTVLSRIITVGINTCSEDECKAIISKENKYALEDINMAVSAYHGNVGKCISFLEKGEYYEIYEKSEKISSCLISGNKYMALKELNEITKRDIFKGVLLNLDEIIRDSLMYKTFGKDTHISGISEKNAEKLSSMITSGRGVRIHEHISDCLNLCKPDKNINLAMLSSKICYEIFKS